jgi:hypothetical protein
MEWILGFKLIFFYEFLPLLRSFKDISNINIKLLMAFP